MRRNDEVTGALRSLISVDESVDENYANLPRCFNACLRLVSYGSFGAHKASANPGNDGSSISPDC